MPTIPLCQKTEEDNDKIFFQEVPTEPPSLSIRKKLEHLYFIFQLNF